MLCASLCIAACADDDFLQLRVDVATGTQGMVVSETSEATRIGRDVLVEGGNAVDAAVAVAFALAMMWPEAGNIGGGGLAADGSGRPASFLSGRWKTQALRIRRT